MLTRAGSRNSTELPVAGMGHVSSPACTPALAARAWGQRGQERAPRPAAVTRPQLVSHYCPEFLFHIKWKQRAQL